MKALALAAVAATLAIGPAWSQPLLVPDDVRTKCAAETQQWSRANGIRGYGSGKQRRTVFMQCAHKQMRRTG